ncbi:hypothetical protein [Terricaulis sp.]|uniref:hypothetical protein n=1 Tax=Terricaulis sp. TaxID=2768686 RepID=UPI003784D1A7
MIDYWFARRFPVGNPRNAMSPVNWKGYLATLAFVLSLGAAGVVFAWLGASGEMLKGVLIFAGAAIVGTAAFLGVVNAKGDSSRTVADYKKGAARA